MSLEGKKILLGVTGGIAAYKAPLILRELHRRGAQVRVVLTQNAQKFVAASTLEVLARQRVYSDLFERDAEFPVLHVGLAGWADLVLVAPATAHFLAKAACGLADDLLSTLVLSTRAPVMVAPSMEEAMLLHPAVQDNAQRLKERGFLWIEPEWGELASGELGQGRLPEPEEIARRVEEHFAGAADLAGMKLLVTAGPTLEDIDPVRFIGNRSSGKMGYALAERARARGARVWLVAGPTQIQAPAGLEEVRGVRSAVEMQREVEALFDRVDGAILAAAVADYRAKEVAADKLKRGQGELTLELVENPDIAAGLGRTKGKRLLVIFAMETEEGVARAREKLRRKGADLVVLNNLREEGAGFAVDTNIVTLIDAEGGQQRLPKMSKPEVADRILDWMRDRWPGRS
jgi:phosphopantothenoylcysteine decarboxylase/phosphopantothenate--cysteine ligase